MKKLAFCIAPVLSAAVIFSGCSHPLPQNSTALFSHVVREEIDEWPDNSYTSAIVEPDAGMPQYVMFDEEKGYYSIVLDHLTMDQGKEYIETLRENGFEDIGGDSNDVSMGQLLQKDDVFLSVAVSDNVLAIGIMPSKNNIK